MAILKSASRLFKEIVRQFWPLTIDLSPLTVFPPASCSALTSQESLQCLSGFKTCFRLFSKLPFLSEVYQPETNCSQKPGCNIWQWLFICKTSYKRSNSVLLSLCLILRRSHIHLFHEIIVIHCIQGYAKKLNLCLQYKTQLLRF